MMNKSYLSSTRGIYYKFIMSFRELKGRFSFHDANVSMPVVHREQRM